MNKSLPQLRLMWTVVAVAALCQFANQSNSTALGQSAGGNERADDSASLRNMLTVSQTASAGAREIKIGWEGQPKDSILVVNIDYGTSDQRRADFGERLSLHYAVLIRQINQNGQTALKVDESKANVDHANFMGALNIFVVPQVYVGAYENEKGAKPAQKRTGGRSFRAADCTTEFQLIGNQKGSWLESYFPGVKIASIETTDDGYVEPSINVQGASAMARSPLVRPDGSLHGENISIGSNE